MSSPSCEEVWSHPGKALKDHLKNVGEIMESSANVIPLRNFDKTIFTDVARLIGLYHDIGKATAFFQEYLREEDPDRKARLKNIPETNHSLFSAAATYFVIEEYLLKKGFCGKLASFLPIVAFLAVRRHHTNLLSAPEDLRLDTGEVLKKQVENLYHECFSFLPCWNTVYLKLKTLPEGWPLRKLTLIRWLKENREVLPYLIQHLFYSLLLDADKHEVTVGSHLERKPLPINMVEDYRRKKGFDKPKKQIDKIRNEIYQKVIKQVANIDLDQDHILSLSAPTGTGKTLTALTFATSLRNRISKEKGYSPRIIYSLPFLSIIDQNAKVIEGVFETTTGKSPTSDLFLIHHHLSDYSYKKEDTEYGTDESEILIEGWDSEIIITTFIQLFHTLFSNRNRAIRKFNKIAGSIIILDEIQSFPHKYWLLFRETAEAMGKYLGSYFILSTATQPAIFKNSRELLIESKKYFKSFKRNQITPDIRSPKTLSEFAYELIQSLNENPKSTMVVVNTIRSAEEIFTHIKTPLKEKGYDIYFLSSYVVPIERLKRIETIKKSTHKKILISTQLVEAGVDIDFERVIRDLGPLDSINQVAGRANRNLNIDLGEIQVVILKDEKTQRPFYSYIYDPVLIDNTKRILAPHSLIPEDGFLALSTQYYQQILQTMSDDASRDYLEAITMLNYEKLSEFELFEERGEKIDIFVELNDEATHIWKQYQEVVEITDPWKKKRRFLEIRGNFYRYVTSILATKTKESLPPEVSGIRFISKGQLNEFYDLETGFKTKSGVSVW